MPAVALEMYFPRWFWWFVVLGSALFAGVAWAAAVETVREHNPWGVPWTVVIFAIAVAMVVGVIQVTVTVLYRPWRSLDSVFAASRPGAVVLPGNRRVPIAALLGACALSVTAIAFAVAASGGWRVFWVIVALLLALAVVDQGISVLHRRRVVLTPTGIRAVSFRRDAEVAWDDIEDIGWVQGQGWLMVARIAAKPDATSFVEHWRHPFARKRKTIDVELLSLDLDPLLVMMALGVFQFVPASRAELATGQVPARLFDVNVAVGSVPPVLGSDWLRTFRPR